MKSLYLFLGLLLLPASLPAQVGFYGMVDATHVNGTAFAGTSGTSSWLYGPTFGVYYTPVHFGPLAAGLDLRGSFDSGGRQHLRSGLVGIRVSGKAPILPLRPYAEGLVGGGGTRTDSTGSLATHYTTKFEYGVLGGLDCTVLPLVDLRVVELGYGHITGISGSSTRPDAPFSCWSRDCDPAALTRGGAGSQAR